MAATVAGILLHGDHASRPAATVPPVGSVYACSDHALIYVTDGSSWSTWASLTGTGAGSVLLAPTGTQLITSPSGGASIPLTIKADAAQSVDALTVYASDGTTKHVAVDKDGILRVTDGTESTDPSAILGFALSTDTATGASLEIRKYATTGNANIALTKGRGTGSAPAIVSNGDAIGSVLFRAYDSGSSVANGAQIAAFVDGTPGATDMPASLRFSTTPDGSGTLAERLRIDNAGRLIFGSGGTGPAVITGTGSPEGSVTAPVGSIYLRTDGASGTTLYVKTSGTGNTGWQAGGAVSADTFVVNFVIDGGGSAITTGVKGDLYFPFACTINEVTLLADQSGSIVLDLWVDTYANYPPTVADTITAAAKPTLSAATKSQDSTLTGWTTAVAAGKSMRVNVDSITTCTRVTMAIKCTRT